MFFSDTNSSLDGCLTTLLSALAQHYIEYEVLKYEEGHRTKIYAQLCDYVLYYQRIRNVKVLWIKLIGHL